MKTTTKPSARPAKTNSVAKKPPIDPVSALPARPTEDIPDLDRSVEVLGAHVVADAIDAYLRAQHRYQVVFSRTGGSPDAMIWDFLAQNLRDDAANAVMSAIICWYYPAKECRDFKEVLTQKWPSLGVSYRGTIYAMTPDPDAAHYPDGETHGNGDQVMCLSVLEPLQGQTIRPDLSELTDLDEFFNRPKAPAPTTTKPEDPLDQHGLGAAFDASEAAEVRARERNRPAYTVTTQDVLLYHESNRTPLDDVIADQVAYVEKHGDDDLAIWRGSKLLAVVVADEDGKGIVTRFDNPEPASQFDLGDITGVELPSPEDAILNAPPEPKPRRKPKAEPKPKAKRTPRTVRS